MVEGEEGLEEEVRCRWETACFRRRRLRSDRSWVISRGIDFGDVDKAGRCRWHVVYIRLESANQKSIDVFRVFRGNFAFLNIRRDRDEHLLDSHFGWILDIGEESCRVLQARFDDGDG